MFVLEVGMTFASLKNKGNTEALQEGPNLSSNVGMLAEVFRTEGSNVSLAEPQGQLARVDTDVKAGRMTAVEAWCRQGLAHGL